MSKGQATVALLLVIMVGSTLNFVMLSWGIGVLLRTLLLTPIGCVLGFQLGRIRRQHLRDNP